MRKKNVAEPIPAVVFKTKLGWAGLAMTESGIRRIVLPRQSRRAAELELGSTASLLTPSPFGRLRAGLSREGRRLLSKAVKLLEKYFHGTRASFDLPLDLDGHTPFQLAVWRAAQKISWGETRSYGWVAGYLGKPKAFRAVGQAMGANPIPIMIP